MRSHFEGRKEKGPSSYRRGSYAMFARLSMKWYVLLLFAQHRNDISPPVNDSGYRGFYFIDFSARGAVRDQLVAASRKHRSSRPEFANNCLALNLNLKISGKASSHIAQYCISDACRCADRILLH